MSFVRNNLDLICAFVGSVLGVILGILSLFNSQYVLATIMFLSSTAFTGYIALRKFGKLDAKLDGVPKSSARLPVLLDGLFLCLIVTCVAVYFTRPLLMERPLLFFILASLAVGVLAVKIFLLGDDRRHRLIILTKIVVVGLGLRLSVLGLYPSIIGQDPWAHMLYAERLKETWDFANINAGWFGMHVIAALGLLGGLTYKAVTMFIFVPIQVIGDVVLIYLIGRELFNSRIGMLASLLLVVAGWHIFFGYVVIPNTLAVTFVLASIYMFIKAHKNRSWRYLIGALASVAVVSYTHSIPVFWLWMLLGIFLCGVLVYRFLYLERVGKIKMVAATCVAIVVIPMVFWVFGTGGIASIKNAVWQVTFEAFARTSPLAVSGVPVVPASPSVFSSIPTQPAVIVEPIPMMQNMLGDVHFPEYLFNVIGVFIFFTLALIGVLYMVSRKHGNLYSFTLGVGGICTAILAAFPQLIAKGVIFSDRGCYLGQIIMAIPLAIALILIVRTIPKWVFRSLAMGLAVGSICFLSIIGKPANTDADIISKNQIVRYGFSQGELDAARWAWVNANGIIGLDPLYVCALSFPDLLGEKEGEYVESIVPYLTDGDFSKCDCSIILIRDEIVDKPIGWGDGRIYRLVYDPNDVLLEQGWQKIFDNGDVCGYER